MDKKLKEMKVFLFPLIFLTFLKKEFIPKAILAFMLAIFLSEILSYSIFSPNEMLSKEENIPQP